MMILRLKNLRLKLKGMQLRKFLIKYGSPRRKVGGTGEDGKTGKRFNHVSHGYHVVHKDHEQTVSRGGFDDSVVVQREQSQDSELWFFGVFDHKDLGDRVTMYIQSNFFNNLPPQSLMEKQSKEVMIRAHENARLVLSDDKSEGGGEEERAEKMGSASAMVINGERLVMADMDGYRAVVCRDGKAVQIGMNNKMWPETPQWSLKLISGVMEMCKFPSIGEQPRSSKVVVGSGRRDSETEFVILASDGIWEVMREQEAVNLIRHFEDAEAAAQCLATEASVRRARATISCLIIRFD